MFGWEFPPFQAGGLATATLGLVKGLLNQGLEVTLVVPFPVQGSALPRRQVIERYGIPAEKVDVVHWGIDQPDAPADLPEPPIIEGRPTVLFLHFAGPLSGVDVHRAFRAADVCVMTSVSEPFGLVALESLRNGTPV